MLYRLLGNIFPHAVIDATTCQNDLGMIAKHLGLVRQVIRIDADTVAANETRTERQEIPLATGRLQHLKGIDADAVKNDG